MMRMWRSFCVITVLLLLAATGPACTHAQAIPEAKGPGAYVAVGGGVSLYQFDYGQRKLGGIAAWADINPQWRYGVEAEVRSLRYHTDEGVTETTYLAGPRVAIFPGPLRPYVKFLAGAGHYDLPFNFAQGTYFTVAPGAGVDIILNDNVAVRLVDFEYQMSTNFQASPNEPPSQLNNYGLTAGISIRLTRLIRFPKMWGYRRREYNENAPQ
jgi:opacity protein-like surface antigen